jgi:hypothetical protein
VKKKDYMNNDYDDSDKISNTPTTTAIRSKEYEVVNRVIGSITRIVNGYIE